ncbi:MAG: tyrosine--tRNA ligase, partial [candidate division NC10 bacterium]
MADSVFNELKWRGFIAQATHAEELSRLLDERPVSFYVGFDPTARSLHLGHLVPILANSAVGQIEY